MDRDDLFVDVFKIVFVRVFFGIIFSLKIVGEAISNVCYIYIRLENIIVLYRVIVF